MKSDKNIREGYKRTTVGVIPEEWEVKDIGKITTYFKGNAFKSKDYKDIGTRIIRVSDLGVDNILNEKDEIFINNLNGIFDSYLLYKGDLICTTVGSKPPLMNSIVGRVIMVDKKNDRTLLNQNAVCLKVKKTINNHYLYNHFKLKRYFNYIGQIFRGNANQANITIKDLFQYELPIPPLPEQQAIANCLTTWDSGIEKLTQLIAAKREQKKGLMQQLLTGKKRLDGFVGEWKEVKINEIAKRVTRKNKELNDTVITISAQRGLVLQEDFFNKRVASATLSNYYLLHKGEFAYNKSYSKGYPMGAFKRLDDFEKAVVTTLYICFKIKDNVNSDFLMNFFEAGLMVNNLMRIAQEGGRAHGLLNIGLADFFNLKLNIPSFEEQTAIAHILTTADQEISLLEAKLAAMKEEKKGLMQVLLTGEKRLIDN